MITCQQLSFAYSGTSTDVISDFSKHFEQGKNYIIQGDHGSGKSTLLKLLASESLSFVDGEMEGDVLHFVPQQSIQFFDAGNIEWVLYEKVFDQFYYTLRCHGFSSKKIVNQIEQLVAYFQISSWQERMFSDLSMGEKQYLKLILAIACREYRVICLDEPFLHLDTQHKYLILQYLQQLNVDFGTLLIVVDHQDQLWLSHLHFEQVMLPSNERYKPWFSLPLHRQGPDMPSTVATFETAPLTSIQNKQILLAPGQLTLVVGNNGAGKSTLCKQLMGMFASKSEQNLTRRMLLPQTQGMYFYPSLAKEWSDSVLETSHPYGDIDPQHLSYGQSKIEMFQRLLADQPQLLILDDPFEGLNHAFQAYMLAQIKLLRQRGSAIVIALTEPIEMEGIDAIVEI